MFRIDNATAAASADAVPAAGTEKFFTEGNPATSVPATDVPAWWLNMVQDELRNILVAAGITPSKASNDQVAAAIAALIAAQTLGGLSGVTLSSPASGQALVYNGSAWVNGTPVSAFDQVQKTLLLNDLKDTLAEGLAARLVNSFPDPFVDLSGIDTANASDYIHDATNALIHNGGEETTASASGEWTGDAADHTFTGDDITFTWGGSSPASDSAIRTSDTISGDFSLTFKYTSGTGLQIGCYPVSSDGSFVASGSGAGNGGGMNGMAASWWLIPSSGTVKYGSTTVATVTAPTSGQTVIIARSGSTFTLTVNGSLVHTWASTSSADMRICLGGSNHYAIADVSWTVGVPVGDLVLPSALLTTLAVPATGHFIGLVEPVDAVTYGTDLTIEITRDDGDTWDEATLTELGTTTITVNGTPTEVDVIYGEVVLTGAAETNGRWRIKGFNSKAFKLHGAAPEFS